MRKVTKRVIPGVMGAVLAALVCSNVGAERTVESEPGQSFDAELAAELGADAYGMRRYVLVLLKPGPNRDHEPELAAELQRGHMENIRRLAEAGHLVLAGPFLESDEMSGLFLFAVDTIDEARELTASDPAISAGRLVAEYHPWYGSAALMKVNDIHHELAREQP